MTQRLFLSAVTDDYEATRRWLAEQLRPAGFGVVIQEEFIELGQNALVKLARSVETESDVVIHLIGPKTGRVPPPDVLATMLAHCGGPALQRRFPRLFENDAYRRVTYTQWEAWLALFYGKRLLPCRDTAPTDPGTATMDRLAPMPVAEHVALLKAEPGYALTFSDRAELLDKVKSALLRLLNQGAFDEQKPQNLPLATLGELFIGRQPFLDDLVDRFRKARAAPTPVYPNHLIHGVGGVGKTRAAVEYGLRHQNLYTALLFVSGESASDLERGLSDLVGVLALKLPAEAPSPERLRAVLAWLKAHPGWLLVVDNVDDQKARDAVNDLLREWHHGHVLITGRFLRWGKEVEPLELSVLGPNDARDFLLKGTAGRRREQPGDDALAKAIAVDDLGQLCLALEQASAYVAHREISFAEYRRRWQANVKDVRTWADKVLMKYREEKDVSLSIATTWQTSVDQLSAGARRLLEMLSWLAPDPLPRTIFDGIERAGGLDDTESLVIELRSFSLLQRENEAAFDCPGKIHRLVQLITREQLAAPRESLAAVLEALKTATAGEVDDPRTWPIWNLLQPHVAVAAQHADAAQLAEPTSFLMTQLGQLLAVKAQYAEAEPLIRRALVTGEEVFGPDHPEVATELSHLAILLKETNRPAEAEPLLRRALAINEASFDPDHPSVAISLNKLAAVLQATNRPAEAEPLKRRGLAIVEAALGPDHPRTAISLNNLARLFEDTGRPAEAEPLLRRALAINEASFDPDHPTVAIALNNLATVLYSTNRLAEAESLMRRHVEIFHQFGRATGHDHPHMKYALHNYRSLLTAMQLDDEEIGRRLAPFLPATGDTTTP